MKRGELMDLIILLALAGLGLYVLKGGNLDFSNFLHFTVQDKSKAITSNVNLSKLYSNYATISNVTVNDSSLNVKVNVEYNESNALNINQSKLRLIKQIGNLKVYGYNGKLYFKPAELLLWIDGQQYSCDCCDSGFKFKIKTNGSIILETSEINTGCKNDFSLGSVYSFNNDKIGVSYIYYSQGWNSGYHNGMLYYLSIANGYVSFLTFYKKYIKKGIIYAPNGVNVNSNNIIKFYANAKKLYLKQQKNNAIMYVIFQDAKINGKYIKNSMMRLDINTTRLMQLINNATQSVNYYYDKNKDADNVYIIIKLDKDLILENKANDTFYNAYLYTSNDLVDVNKVSNEALTSQVLDAIVNAFSLIINGDKASFTITKIVFPANQKIEIKISKTWIDYSALTKDRATEMLLESSQYSNQLNGNAKTYNIVFNSNTWIKNFYKQANSNLILAFDS